MILEARGRQIRFPRRPLVMGIVNLTDDSFCGDGTLDPALALNRAAAVLRDGADIIDIGAESARTNRGAISEAEEIRRLRPFVERWREWMDRWQDASRTHRQGACVTTCGPHGQDARTMDAEQLWPPLLSINTWRPAVVEQILPLGGDLLNDIGGLTDDSNARLCARHGAALLIMHSVGEPKVPHTHVTYPDVMASIGEFFDQKIRLATAASLAPNQIVLDPGIDFAKQKVDNLAIYRHLADLHRFGRPILLPVSRKTVIGEVLDLPNPNDRDAGTIACIATGLERGAHIFRVHNVRAAAQTVKVLNAVRSSSLRAPP